MGRPRSPFIDDATDRRRAIARDRYRRSKARARLALLAELTTGPLPDGRPFRPGVYFDSTLGGDLRRFEAPDAR